MTILYAVECSECRKMTVVESFETDQQCMMCEKAFTPSRVFEDLQ